MKYEEERNKEIRENGEQKIDKLEAQTEKIRDRLAKELSILTNHELTLSRMQYAGRNTEGTQRRVDNKREQVKELELRLKALETACEILRQELLRLLDFNPVQDSVNAMPQGFRLAGQEEWRIKNSRFKTFQDVFTPVDARVIPESDRRLSADDYNELPLDACPVDPQLVPDWLIDEFDLGRLKGMSDFEKMERKAKAVPEIRHLFTHLNPIIAHQTATYRLMVLEGYSPDHDGKILKFSYSGTKAEDKDSKEIHRFGSIYSAHRSAHYTDEGYSREEAKIHGIQGRVKGIQKNLIGKRQNDPAVAKLMGDLQQEITLLLKSRAYHKVEAAGVFVELADIRDNLGKHNPGRACAKIVKGLNTLKKRLPQVFNKNAWNLTDRQVLESTIQQGKESMDIAYNDYLDLCHLIEDGGDAEAVAEKLRLLPDLSELRVRPFSQYATKLQQKAAAIQTALQAGDMEAVRDEAIDAYVAAKTFQAQHERERVLRDMAASPMDIGVDALLARALALHDAVTSKETFPNVRTGCNQAYDEMARKLGKLVRGLKHYNAKALTVNERLAMYERLKVYLEEINFVEVLDNLD